MVLPTGLALVMVSLFSIANCFTIDCSTNLMSIPSSGYSLGRFSDMLGNTPVPTTVIVSGLKWATCSYTSTNSQYNVKDDGCIPEGTLKKVLVFLVNTG